MLREYSSPPTGNVSCIRCHVSHVTCHMSCVTCQFFFKFIYFFLGQLSEAYRWRVCYQRGLPRLVFFHVSTKTDLFLEEQKNSYNMYVTIETVQVLKPMSHTTCPLGELF